MTGIPAAERTLAILRALAQAPGPLPAATLASRLAIPRSSIYQLLAVLASQGFVVHLPEEERWGLGVGAFEIGAAYLRHDPLERLAQPLLRRLVGTAGRPVVAHLGVLHGDQMLYLLKERSNAPVTVVTDVGVRLPAALTASGRAILALLSRAQVRAQLSGANAFVDRTGRGPATMAELTAMLADDRARGYAVEDGFITAGYASVAAAAIDHRAHPVASISLTYRADPDDADGAAQDVRAVLGEAVVRCARDLSARLGAR